ncbi:MAG TPA: hypothetical protein ENJ45_05430 [Phaeodactylibacter sp.]|nr:hypothetical protein [Phaeodactylibacter sp.]
MDPKKFDDIFSKKLKETQSFQYLDSDWESIVPRIQKPEKDNRYFLWIWALASMLIILLGISIYLAVSLHKTNMDILDLKNSIQTESTPALSKENMQESLPAKEQMPSNANTTKLLPFPATPSDDHTNTAMNIAHNSNTSRKLPGHNTPNKSPHVLRHTKNKKTNTTTKAKTKEETNSQQVSHTVLLPNKIQHPLLSNNEWMPINHLAVLPPPIKPVNNKLFARQNFSSGLTGLVSFSIASGEKDALLSTRPNVETLRSKKDKNSFDIGLFFRYKLHTRWNLVATLGINQTNYHYLTRRDTISFITIDVQINANESIEYNPEGVAFESANSTNLLNDENEIIFKQYSLAYSLGSEFLFRPNKKWRPYIGLSLYALSVQSLKVFGRPSEPISAYSLDKSSSTQRLSKARVPKHSFYLYALVPSVGFQQSIGSKIDWYLALSYQQTLYKKNNYLLAAPWALQSTVAYRFR